LLSLAATCAWKSEYWWSFKGKRNAYSRWHKTRIKIQYCWLRYLQFRPHTRSPDANSKI
jgi:hypothetical protein